MELEDPGGFTEDKTEVFFEDGPGGHSHHLVLKWSDMMGGEVNERIHKEGDALAKWK